MMGERSQQIERICQQALDLQGTERVDYLNKTCGDDGDLRREVESLLALEVAAERFIEAPAIEHVARTLATTGTLPAGSRIGPYEVVAVLGSGGMGDVYRARDMKLGREAAIKVLPRLFLSDSARRRRFEQEARTLAALNHPHIATIYGTDESTGVPALILELVEGETLQSLLARSARRRLPLAKALDIARQIADALESAHDKGIVHRDLKPSNIHVTADGRVKVLDFGLATALTEHDGASADLLFGSPAYMSPEHVQGLTTDKRTDVWAFGCLLFEMLSGRRVFGDETPAAALESVVNAEPEWSALPEPLPPAIGRLLRRCLRKDRRQRLADIADARLEIDEALSAPAPPTRSQVRSGRERVAWLVAGVCLLALVAGAAWMRTVRPQPRLVRFSIDVPEMADAFFMSLSPDGSQIVYPAAIPGGLGLWIRRLDSVQARFLPGTEGALLANWSPDSRFVAIVVDHQLKKIDVKDGGPPQTLTTVYGDVRRTAWSRNGVILIADDFGGGLGMHRRTIRRIADTGGQSSEVTTLDVSRQEATHGTPWFLPDGRHFLYTAWSSSPEHSALYVSSLDSPIRTRLMAASSKALYTAGFIVFRRDEKLMAQPFDATRLTLTGAARPVADSVQFNPELGQSAFSVSDEGTLAYVANEPDDVRLMWVDRDGHRQEIDRALSGALNPSLSPDGTRIAFHAGATPDIWTYDIARRQPARLTTHGAADRFPLFSRDGLRMLFASNRENPAMAGLYEKPADGAVSERAILDPKPDDVNIPRDWSRDGRTLVFETGGGFGTPRDIWLLPMGGAGKPQPYAASSADERHPALSPDGQWLAYTSNESGRYQIIVQSFPDPTIWKVPIGSGRFPRWRGDGKELYFLDSTNLMAVSVRTTPTFQILGQTRLFDVPSVPGFNDLQVPYDVAPDGQRFLLSTRASAATGTEIRVVLGWPSLLSN